LSRVPPSICYALYVVRINDRGPFIRGRIIDLSRKAAELTGMRSAGVAEVIVKVITLPK
jgi:rare lipoprotein A